MSYEFGFSGFCTHAAEYCQRSLCPYICLARPSWWRLPKEELPPAPVQRTCCMTQLLGTDDACACIFCLYRSAWDSDSLTDVKRQWTKNTSIGRCEFGQTFLASAAFLLVVRSRKMTFRWPFLPKTATNWLHFLQTTKFYTSFIYRHLDFLKSHKITMEKTHNLEVPDSRPGWSTLGNQAVNVKFAAFFHDHT